MKVWRLEDEKGYGPFTGGGYGFLSNELFAIGHPGHSGYEFPNAYDEGLSITWANNRFGAASLDQLYHWFPKEILPRVADIWHIAVYEASDFVCGKYQVVFNYSTARRLPNE